MNEFFTVKALLNAWRQLGLKMYSSSSKTPIISASRFASVGCTYVYFSYQPMSGLFYVSLTYRKDGQRFEKECETTSIRKAMKIAYLYGKELDTM